MKSIFLRRGILFAAGLFFLAVIAVTFLWRRGDTVVRAGEGAAAPLPSVEDGHPQLLTIATERRAAFPLATCQVQQRSLEQVHVLPGRITYDDNRHIEVQAPVAGVLLKMLVKPGDRVRAGDVLAWLSCPEVGEARADSLKRESECEIAGRQLEWRRTLHANVQHVLASLKREVGFEDLRLELEQRTLGDYRTQLLAAYSEFLLADKLASNAQSLSASGVLADVHTRRRAKDLQAAEAVLRGVCEQVEFEARQQLDLAELASVDAQRRWQIARQHLAALLLSPVEAQRPTSEPNVEQAPVVTEVDNVDPSQPLSVLAIRAPFAGTIEQRTVAAAERVARSEPIFVLADTSRLWVQVDIRETDWLAVTLKPGRELTLETPALPGRKLTARVYFVGRNVSPDTNAVPLVAEVANSEGLLLPGLYVRVSVPIGTARPVPVVPAAAVQEHEGQPFVFLPETKDSFRRVNIRTGINTGDWVEVVSGLQAGQTVVSQGAFLLKSELLLEGEE